MEQLANYMLAGAGTALGVVLVMVVIAASAITTMLCYAIGAAVVETLVAKLRKKRK